MMPEILSPVGSLSAFTAALRAGADAVYLGFGDFNARKNANNFDDGTVTSAVCVCHRQNVKVYITLNTLIFDDEFPAVLETIRAMCKAGVDGVIVQDLGLAALIKKCAPTLPLHASTQMSVFSPAAIPLLKELSFSRVVPAREMSKSELELFCEQARKLNIETEVFVHGALCMCVSGQCYMSAMLGGRSGNRGLCAQPCRLPFSLGGENDHALSLKDLSLISHIDELSDMGISSLKIEGRMKRPEYVAAATAACLDYKNPSAMDRLSSVFSRSGFTSGYFDEKVTQDMFGRRSNDDVMLTKEVLPSIHELYRRERSRVPVSMTLSSDSDTLTLTISDGENMVSVKSENEGIPKPLPQAYAMRKLEKLGGTNYYLENSNINIDENFKAAFDLTKMKNTLIEQLNKLRETTKSIPFDYNYVNQNCTRKPTDYKSVFRFSDISQMSDSLEKCTVILPIETDFDRIPKNIDVQLEIPRAFFGKEKYIEERLKMAADMGYTEIVCENIAAIELARKAGLNAHGGFGLNVFNSRTLAVLAHLGVKSSVLSPELTLEKIAHINSEMPIGAIIYGHLPLMLTRNCPVKLKNSCANCSGTLVDRKGVKFPVKCRMGCSEIFNSVPIYMAERQSELKGLDFGLFYFTNESKNEAARIINDYKNKSAAQGEFTRGMFYRGVL